MTLRGKNLFSFIRKAFSLPGGLRARFAAPRFPGLAMVFLAALVTAPRADAASGCFSAPPGLVGWWPGDGSAADIASTNNGTLQGGATANAPGVVGTAFSFDGTNSFVQIPNAASLQPTNLTIEAWVRFSSIDSPGLGGSPAGDQYIVFKQNSRSGNFEGFDLSKTRVGANDVFRFLITSASAQSSEVHSVTTISTNVWYHVAGVRGSNFLQIYVNGVLEQQTNITFPQDYGNFPLYFGTSGESYWDHKLSGNLDEVSLYNRALSSSEIASIYAAGGSGKCKAPNITAGPQSATILAGSSPALTVTATGFAPLAYQWSFNGGSLPAATNQTLILTNIQPGSDGNYSVTGTNNLGVAASSNALLLVNDVQPGVPFITSFSPATAVSGASVTITGFNFSPMSANNIVYFGSVRANVTAATSSSLTVTVPAGAIFAPLTVNVNGLIGWSRSPFQPTFIGSGGLSQFSFPVGYTEPFANGATKIVIADLDGDGKPDLIFADGLAQSISLLRNISTAGTLTPNSFSPRVDIPGTYSNTADPLWVQAADIDGDGKLDLIVGDRGTSSVLIYRNISTPGSLTAASFAPPVSFSVGADPRGFHIADLDGDGRPDIVVAGLGANVVTILQNVGTPGNLNSGSFVRYDLPAGNQPVDIAIADFNGDGRADLAVLLNGGSQVQIYRNVSVPGTGASTWFVPDVNMPTPTSGNGINAADLDGDGKPDLAVASSIGMAVTVYHNTSTPANFPGCSFDPGVAYGTIGWSHNVEVADLNGDQKPDLVADGELPSFMSVFQNQSAPGNPFNSGSFNPQVDFGTGYNAWGVAVGDLDGDGRPDIVFCNYYDNTITFYQNQVPYGGPPVIQVPPTNFTATVGNTATFSAAALGLAPLTYQWQFNGSNLPGANSSQLYLPNIQLSQAGNYSVVVSNSLGAATSSVATLTLNLTLTCTSPPSGLVSWWTGDNTTLDSAGINTGTLIGNATYGPGRVNEAFVFDGNASGVSVGNPANLQLQSFTIAAWIQRASSSIATYNPNGTAIIFGYGSGGYGLGIANTGLLFLTRVGIDNVSVNPSLTDTNFHHVAVTKNGTTVIFYIDGVVYPAPVYGDTFAFSSPAGIGNTADTLTSGFFGSIDDVAVFNRALAPAEIQSIYNSGGAGMCPLPASIVSEPASQTYPTGVSAVLSVVATGSPPVSYQWFDGAMPLSDGGRITGSLSNLLTVSNLQTGDAGNYLVVVSNAAGAQTSTVAALTVFVPPSFTIQPVSQTWITGSNYTLTSLATGTQPINYQWSENGVMMTDNGHFTGTATSSLSVSNVQTSDAATYTVVASNLAATSSSNAVITVVVPPSITTQPRGWSVPLGFPVTFTSGASGTGPVGFQWLLNGSPVSPGTGSSLTISNTAPASYGNYQLVATNAGGAVTSAVAQLTLGPVGTWGSFAASANFPIWPAAGLSNVVAVAGGSGFSLALRGDGTVSAWGGATVSASATNLPAGLTDIVGIASGSGHALALHANGTVTAWGLDTSGQTNVPAGLSNVIAVTAGASHSAALRSDGTVAVWGVSGREAETNIPPGLFNVTAIDAGASQTIAVRADGTAVSWGGSTPLPVPPNLTGLTGAAAGQSVELNEPFALAVNSNGLVTVWGLTGAPTNVPPGLNSVAAVAAGGSGSYIYGFAMALVSNGPVAVWVASAPQGGSPAITNVPAGATNVVAIAGGQGQALVLINDGRPQIIGPPVGGTFYSGRDLVLKARAVGAAPLSYLWLKGATRVGSNPTLDIPSAQSADAGTYQLVVSNPLGIAQSVSVPVVIVDSPPVLTTQPQSGFAYYGSPLSIGAALIGSGPLTMQWLQNGSPVASGTNILNFSRAMPQLGGAYRLVASNPFGAVTSSVAQITFTRLAQWGTGPALSNAPFNLGTVVAVASGYSHALALNADGTVSAWATNSTTATNVPAGLNNVIAIAAGNNSSLALKNDGTVVGWGSTASNVPAGLSNVVAIAVGNAQQLALLANGTVVGWGSGSQATPPPGLSNVVAISAGATQSLALKGDGTIVGWGTFGKIPGTTNLVAISAGNSQSLAL
jgi:alpha-tubulin suppressor-like RCC1 family protein